MKKIVLAYLMVFVLLIFASPVFADDYEDWGEIRPLLKDGAGGEFVKGVVLPSDYFTGATELDAVQAVVTWVFENYHYLSDVGEVWTSSDQMYTRLQGDCEDWAILTTALLRFHTQYGGKTVSSDKVWVAINLVTEPGVGVYAAHAWVGYKLDKGGLIRIEPGSTALYRGGPYGMLNFNDAWVKGGGIYLAGDITTVEELVGNATSIHLEVLAKIYEKVPDQAKETIEKAMTVSAKGHEKTTEVLVK